MCAYKSETALACRRGRSKAPAPRVRHATTKCDSRFRINRYFSRLRAYRTKGFFVCERDLSLFFLAPFASRTLRLVKVIQDGNAKQANSAARLGVYEFFEERFIDNEASALPLLFFLLLLLLWSLTTSRSY